MSDWAGRSLWRLSLLWWLSLLMLPLLLIQGLMTRRLALRLPEGEPPNEGCAGGPATQSISLIGLGDSVIAGVGVERMAESLTAKVAEALARRTECTCHWSAFGTNGDVLHDLLARISGLNIGQVDVCIVSIGVNDVTRLTSLVKWQLGLTRLTSTLRDHAKTIVLLGVPPMGRFLALPQPLRWVLGIRAAMLDTTLEQLGHYMKDVYWVNAGLSFDESYLAEDGYHPGADACELMAKAIADRLVAEWKA